MSLVRGIHEYIALDANNINFVPSSTRAILLTSLAIYSCIPLKAIQYYIIIIHTGLLVAKIKSCIPRAL